MTHPDTSRTVPNPELDDTLRDALRSCTEFNNRIGKLVLFSLLIPPLLLVVLFLAVFAMYKSTSVIRDASVKPRWDRFRSMSRDAVTDVANGQGDDALLARFRLSYRHAYQPLIAIPILIVFLIVMNAMM